MDVPDSRLQDIRNTLKRCSEKTLSAAARFFETRDPAAVPVIVFGILERELPKESAGKLNGAPGSSRLVEDVGIDSLGLMEAVMSVEDVLGITIDNSELRKIATLDDLNEFITEKLKAAG